VTVPEWDNVTVYVKVMDAFTRDQWETSTMDAKSGKMLLGNAGFRASLVARCLVDEKGELLFKPNEVSALAQKSSIVLDRLFAVALRVNKITKEEQESLEKNSEADPHAS
jgi:hypothetical protein